MLAPQVKVLVVCVAAVAAAVLTVWSLGTVPALRLVPVSQQSLRHALPAGRPAAAQKQHSEQHGEQQPPSAAAASADADGSDAEAVTVDEDEPLWPSDGWDESGSSCRRNGLLAAPNKLLWRYHDDKTPGLADAAHAGDRVYIVFSTKLPQPHFDHWRDAHRGSWNVTFHDSAAAQFEAVTVAAGNLGRDGHGHTFTLHAQIPQQLLEQQPRSQSLRVSVHGLHKGRAVAYTHVPLCLLPDTQPSHFRHLIACTEVTRSALHQVPEWVAYHALQGVQHFYLYVNDDVTAPAVRQPLDGLVHAGLLTVVDWSWPSRYNGQHQFQQAEQNGCLLRARGRARWVMLTDVDEFLEPLQPGLTVAQFLHDHSGLEHVGALIVTAVWRGRSADAARQEAWQQAGGGLRIATFVARSACCDGRKLLANPRGMSYNSVHEITAGGVQHELNAEKELRINHIKPDNPGRVCDVEDDTALAQHAPAVREKLSELGYAFDELEGP